MKKRLIIVFAIAGLALGQAGYVWSAKGDAGTTAVDFLKIGVGARPSAIGGAYTAVSGDAWGMLWNPAGLACLDRSEIALMHIEWFQGIDYEFAGYAQPVESGLAFGAGITYVDLGSIERTTWDHTDGSLGSFRSCDTMVSLAAGYQLSPAVSAGGGFKFISEKIDSRTAMAGALDVGAIYSPVEHISFAVAVQNLGTKIKFYSDGADLPLNFSFGTAVRLLNNDMVVVLDLNKGLDTKLRFGVGAEYRAFNIIALRAGYNSRNDLDTGLTVGTGLRIQDFSLDYAFVPFGDLGNTHKLSGSWRFGKAVSKQTSRQKKSSQPTAEAAVPEKQHSPAAEEKKEEHWDPVLKEMALRLEKMEESVNGLNRNVTSLNDSVARFEQVKPLPAMKEFLARVFFESGKATLDGSARETLKAVAEKIRTNPGQKILIEGHADQTQVRSGGNLANENLARARAEAVSGFLKIGCGISDEHLTLEIFGSDVPVGPNDTETGRSLNRRAEIFLLN